MIKREKKKTIFDKCYRKRRNTFCNMGIFHVCNIGISCFMGKNYSENWHSIKNTEDLTMKQMFDISAKLVSEQHEIFGVKNN